MSTPPRPSPTLFRPYFIEFRTFSGTPENTKNRSSQKVILTWGPLKRADGPVMKGIIDGVSVHQSRLNMGSKLAKRIKESWPEHDIDVVIPVPDSGRISAIQLAKELGVDYREGLVKNRYIGRTFIMPGQSIRRDSVRKKLNTIDHEFAGKKVLLVDDSIVRGNTSRKIVEMARKAGATKVYFASAAPPVR